MPPKFEVRDVLRTLEEAGLENKLPIYDDGRMIAEVIRVAMKDDMKFGTRKYRAPYVLEELELRQEEKKMDAAGPCMYPSLSKRQQIRRHLHPCLWEPQETEGTFQ